MTALVVRSDAGRLPLPDNFVDLIVTSPPYFALRSYTDGGEHYAGQIGSEGSPQEFLEALLACTREWIRVLRPAGSIFVNLGDKYAGGGCGPQGMTGQRAGRKTPMQATRAARAEGFGVRNKSLLGLPWRYALGCIDDLGLILRSETIWSKPNGMPESVTDRVRRSHEQWFHLTVRPDYFSSLDAIRLPHKQGGVGATWAERKLDGQPMRHGDTGGGASAGAPGPRAGHVSGALPGSVWEIPSEPLTVPDHLGIDHFAAFPTEWPRRIIQGWAPADGVVLDPFGGTGTTALCASVLGRIGISVDLSHDYSRLAQWRTTDPASRAKAMRVEKPPLELVGQDDLFGAAS